jgi:hypothetical protein
VQQVLIAEIRRTSIWPVVVTVDGNIRIPEISDFIDRDGSYIILIPDGNIKSLLAEIIGLTIDGTKFTRVWNPEARFVVAEANEISVSQQTDIFDYFSKYKCIIVSQERYVIEKDQQYTYILTLRRFRCNHCFSGKYATIPYCECVIVAFLWLACNGHGA